MKLFLKNGNETNTFSYKQEQKVDSEHNFTKEMCLAVLLKHCKSPIYNKIKKKKCLKDVHYERRK